MRLVEECNFRTADAFTENDASTGTGRLLQNQLIFGGDAMVMP